MKDRILDAPGRTGAERKILVPLYNFLAGRGAKENEVSWMLEPNDEYDGKCPVDFAAESEHHCAVVRTYAFSMWEAK